MVASRWKDILLALALAMSPMASLAQDCNELQGQPRFLGAQEGRDYLGAVAVGGDRILGVTSDAQLITLQQEPTGAPVEISEQPLDTGDLWIAAIDQVVYVSGLLGVKIFQIQPDGSATMLGFLTGQEAAAEIKASGHRLAVVHEGTWSLWDCATPSSPVLLAQTEFLNSTSSYELAHLALGPQHAVVNELVYDLADPTLPLSLPPLPSSYAGVHGQEIAGQHLYQFKVSYQDGGSWIFGDRWFLRHYGVSVLDLSESDNYPVLADHDFNYSTSFPLAAPTAVMNLSEGRILAGQTHDPSLLIIDTSLPADAEPYHIPVLPSPVLAFQDEQLVGLGTKVWAFEAPGSMDTGTVTVSSVGEGGGNPYGTGYDSHFLFDVDARDDWLVVCTGRSWSDGQYMWDDSSEVQLYRTVDGSLQNISNTVLYGQWNQIALGEGYIFLNSYGLYSMDISDPANPGDLVQVPGISTTYGLASLGGGFIATGNSTGVMSVWNLADPESPVLVGSCDLGERAGLFTRNGQTLLATLNTSQQVAVVDLSNPAAPQVVQFVSAPGTVRTLSANNGQAMALSSLDGERFLSDFDYQVPGGAGPDRTVVTTVTPMYLNSLAWHGQQVFLGGFGLHAYDPTQGSHIGSVPTSHSYLGLVSYGGNLHAITADGLLDVTEIVCGDQGISAVDPDLQGPRNGLDLMAAPNPFNPMTRFSFTLDKPQFAELVVYDIKGRMVRQLLNEMRPAGSNHIEWNGRGNDGRLLSSGVYFGRLETTSGFGVTRVLLLK